MVRHNITQFLLGVHMEYVHVPIGLSAPVEKPEEKWHYHKLFGYNV